MRHTLQRYRLSRRDTADDPFFHIFFCGDTHSRFRHLIAAVKQHRPAAIVLLGDVQATKPLQDELAAILSLTEIYWIAGNHDTDSPAAYDHLFESELRDRNLHGRVVTIAGVRIAGLGGIFREKVWFLWGHGNLSGAIGCVIWTRC